MIIGVTGETGSGKTTVSEYLKGYSYTIINGDKVARMVEEPNKPCYNEIVDYFGIEILNNDKTINRKKLGDMVFSDEKLLKVLNLITHKYIYSEINESVKEHLKINPNAKIAIDAALLYQIGLDKLCDEVWFIESKKDIRIKRIIERNNYNYEDAQIRVNAQDFSKNKMCADRIIYNDGSMEGLFEKIKEIISM
jgi:dephospho-CoA kinase